CRPTKRSRLAGRLPFTSRAGAPTGASSHQRTATAGTGGGPLRASSPRAPKTRVGRGTTHPRAPPHATGPPALAAPPQPPPLHPRHAVVITSPFGDIPCADANAYSELDLRTLVASCDQSLNLRRRPDRVPSPAKRRHVAVARTLDDLTVVRGDASPDQRVVLIAHRVVSILPERNQRLCRTDQIREQQRERAGPWHNSSVDPAVRPR